MQHRRYDVVILGGGHNGLVSAAYLARAGLSVLVLERKRWVGGAAVSAQVFAGVNARLSRYAYLVSLFPQKIIDDLGLQFQTRRRAVASYTPSTDGRALLVSNTDEALTAESFRRLTGSEAAYRAFRDFYAQTATFAQRVFPTLTEPLRHADDHRAAFTDAPQIWENLVERPLGEWVERAFEDDLVRGLVFTDGKIGVQTHPHDPSLVQNRCFIYHIIGGGTGEWRIPVGGMGAVTSALETAARQDGATILTGAEVTRITPDGEVMLHHEDQIYTIHGRYLLANVAPTVLAKLLGQPAAEQPEGSSFKINMLLKRLPHLRSDDAPEQAFAGTFHINEGYQTLIDSHQAAQSGALPDPLPCETYCHTLTDSSILGADVAGYHTLTLFGIDAPARLFREDNAAVRAEVLRRCLAGLNQYLAEPIEDCLATDVNGAPCIEAKSPLDIAADLNMPDGHIFHKDLSWLFAENEAEVGTWGVETSYPNILLCGSGAKRGGAVSGVPGHNAAMKVLECEGRS
jgi:phytoene dehydrogenase-like protein